MRFTVPGYIFIILFILINPGFLSHGALLGLNIEDAQGYFGIIFGFLSLLGGSAFGFLISQSWWLYWTLIGSHYGEKGGRERREPYNILVNEYSINNNEDDLRTVYNYLVHTKADEKTKLYINRRWDTFILLGSSAFAILLGLVSGYIMKLFVFHTKFTTESGIYHLSLSVSFIFLFFFLFHNSRHKILTEHDNMTMLLIRDLGAQNQLRDLINIHYFSN